MVWSWLVQQTIAMKNDACKQTIRHRVQNNGYKDAQGAQWELQGTLWKLQATYWELYQHEKGNRHYQ